MSAPRPDIRARPSAGTPPRVRRPHGRAGGTAKFRVWQQHLRLLARIRRTESLSPFREALRADLDDTQGRTTGEGIHLGGMPAPRTSSSAATPESISAMTCCGPGPATRPAGCGVRRLLPPPAPPRRDHRCDASPGRASVSGRPGARRSRRRGPHNLPRPAPRAPRSPPTDGTRGVRAHVDEGDRTFDPVPHPRWGV